MTMDTDTRPTVEGARVLARFQTAKAHFTNEGVFNSWQDTRDQLGRLLAAHDMQGGATDAMAAAVREQAWKVCMCLESRTEAAKRRHTVILPDDESPEEMRIIDEANTPPPMPAVLQQAGKDTDMMHPTDDPKWRSAGAKPLGLHPSEDDITWLQIMVGVFLLAIGFTSFKVAAGLAVISAGLTRTFQ